MTKNVARKGLALGSTFALAFASLVGIAAPAHAANLTVIPSSGTSTTFISGETFSVKVLGQFAAADALRWEIAGIDTATETVTATVAGGQAVAGTTTQTVTPTTVATTAGGNALSVAVTATQTASVTVRAYVESGDAAGFNAAYDTSYSAPITLNFVKAANAVPTVTLTGPTEDDTTITAAFSLNGINNEQLTNTDFAVSFTAGDGSALAGGDFKAGGTVAPAITGSEVVIAPAAWDATDGFVATSGTLTALVKATYVKAQVVYNDGGVQDTDGAHPLAHADNVAVGDAAVSVVATRAAATIVGAGVASVTATASKFSTDSSFQVKATVKDGAATPAGVSGATVTAKITSAGLSATAGSEKTLTVNGTTYSDSTKLPGQAGIAKVSVTTDADGVAVLNLTTSGYTAADTIAVIFYTENLTAATLTMTAEDPTYTTTADLLHATTDGGTVAVAVSVYDQFGGRPSDLNDATAELASSTQATTAATAASDVHTAMVGGEAVLYITDNGTGAGVNTYNVKVQKRAAGGGYSAALTGTATQSVVIHIKAAADLVPGTVTTQGTKDATTGIYAVAGTQALSLVDYANYDSTNVVDTAPAAFVAAVTAVSLNGVVSTAATSTKAAAVIPNASVTVSSANLSFTDGAGKYSVGSITVDANASGAFTVSAFSHTAGKQTVTLTSGGVTTTATITFAAAAIGTATSLEIIASDYASAGSTVIAKAVAKDKYGNPVAIADGGASDFDLTYDGPGLAVTARADATDADGEAQIAYFLGSNDTGTITITARYDIDNNNAYTDTGDLVVTKTITIGEAPADTKVNAGSFKGYVAIYAKGHEGKRLSAKVGKDWVVVPALASNFVRVVEYTGAGYTIAVRIYIDRVLVDTITVTTK